MTNRLMAGVSRFAHFAGFAPSAAKGSRAEDDYEDEPKGKKGSRASEDGDEDEDNDEPKGKRGSRASEGDDEDDDKPKGKRGSKASEDDDDDEEGKRKGKRGAKASEDDEDDDKPKGKRGSKASDDEDEDDDKPKGKKSRRARADDDDDDDSGEMSGKSAVAAARRRERARCAAIFSTVQAAANPTLACTLAFETTMTRQEAIAVLASQPAPAVGASDGRLDYSQRRSSRNPDLIDDTEASAPQSKDMWSKAHATVSAQSAPKGSVAGSFGWGDAHARSKT